MNINIFNERNYVEALQFINQATTLNSKNEKLLDHKGITLMKLDQYQQDFECLMKQQKLILIIKHFQFKQGWHSCKLLQKIQIIIIGLTNVQMKLRSMSRIQSCQIF
ncbi:unnamed protein product [Paramecium pentaurelia]|uniref:Uncharacterized protein n=1 Tax=Paramecium pentaurelia TaxID=43138 RepID=A0A8S1RYZ5_9CILI|nr:unnamed protein product [Paramecium pentaurelia]